MKKRVLLIDESLTVQKVVSLTLDKQRYQVTFAKSRSEAMKLIVEHPPELILVSDQVSDINASSFPKELETWLGGVRDIAPVILITGSDIKEQKHYAAVLRKPFLPAVLQETVDRNIRATPAERPSAESASPDEFEDQRLQKIFNDTFADEAQLVKETFRAESSEFQDDEPTKTGAHRKDAVRNNARAASLWDADATDEKRAPSVNDDSLWDDEEVVTPKAARESSPAVSEKELERSLKATDLDQVVDRLLSRIVPPIVERLVQERLDKLMKEQEQFVELKP